MLTVEDIRNVTFRKSNFGGYRPEDVEVFIEEVQASFESLTQENNDLLRKLELLAKKVEEYREDEESIRTAVISAQKLGDASIREAKRKSEEILKDASLQAENIMNNAQNEIKGQQLTLENLKKEVSAFRSNLLSIYREHLTLIDALPSESDAENPEEENAQRVSEKSEPEEKQTVNGKERKAPNQMTLPVSFPTEETQKLEEDPIFSLTEKDQAELAKSLLEEEKEIAEKVSKEAADSAQKADGLFTDDVSQDHPEADSVSEKSRFNSIKFGDNYEISGGGKGSRSRRKR